MSTRRFTQRLRGRAAFDLAEGGTPTRSASGRSVVMNSGPTPGA